ncbi:alpha-L-rhamnosidase C-terminal domain-containing protein [Mucilaginibacter sp. JRF]|uniref:alpha-L-rhamnosidase-related protein n=1 Tax=Mucilaginibacter sp. JRF TaxID=2780088 RepID=UPI001D169100|nr:alpha-L-rhamnosidase C-terminal domain-containing protein [Mucilaginibacter sp. JRF]
MINHLSRLLLLISALFCSVAYAQSPSDQAHKWSANWIAKKGSPGTEYGIYYFRKNISLASRPATFKVNVSADNRYKLYVNEKLVSIGPARGDMYSWNYETVDLAPYLKPGKNIIAALVFNEAEFRPVAQISFRTAFMLQGEGKDEDVINTNKSWKVIQEQAYQPHPGWFPIAASKGEIVDMNKLITGWQSVDFDDSQWGTPDELFEAKPKGQGDGFGWMLTQSPIAQMELTDQRISTLRKAIGIKVPAGFPKAKVPLVIPANTVVKLLLDQDTLTNAYTNLEFSGGKGAGIAIRYAETLYEKQTEGRRKKGNRNEVEGKEFIGRSDSLISNGNAGQKYTTLYWRTYRYIQLTIRTGDAPLTINDFYGTFTGYPFRLKAKLNTADTELKKIMDIGWRTARLCAIETYFDCPYYEQLQYIGDTRIQALVSYYNAGNDSLARNSINQIDGSRLPEGVTQSRWPSNCNQVIPGFSLWYIGMLHDYWMYRNDEAFVKGKLPGERAILGFFEQYQQADGSLKDVPFWTFADWVEGHSWDWGNAPKGADGSSAVMDMQLLYAYQWAAAMEEKLGMAGFADHYHKKAEQLLQTIRKKYWDDNKQLFAETAEKNSYSQHANSLAILTGAAPKENWQGIGQRILSDSTLAQCSIYFKYYMHLALTKAGMGNDYLSWLGVWKDDMKLGLTTWAEEPDAQVSRSDCHAWGASPNIEIYRTILGIDSETPGFQNIIITPNLGQITNISGSMPHPNGMIDVAYVLKKGKWNININLPGKTAGKLIWKGKEHTLKAGKNVLTI